MKKHRVRAIINIGDGLVLIRRIKNIEGRKVEYHVFPGGGVEVGETLEQAVVREVNEEIGIKVEPLNKLYVLEEENNVQVFIVCKYIEGVIGTGQGPEFTSIKYKDRGLYIPEIVPVESIAQINILEVIKNALMQDIQAGKELSKLETKYL